MLKNIEKMPDVFDNILVPKFVSDYLEKNGVPMLGVVGTKTCYVKTKYFKEVYDKAPPLIRFTIDICKKWEVKDG